MIVSDGVNPSPKGGPEPARPSSKSATTYRNCGGAVHVTDRAAYSL